MTDERYQRIMAEDARKKAEWDASLSNNKIAKKDSRPRMYFA